MKAALTQLTWQHYRLNPDLPSEEKMGCLLVSHFTKSASSTIYKMNRNFHYFSWHTCLYLATVQREPAETEEALRGTAQRGACCCHPCQPSLCHQLWPLGKTAALSTHLKAIYTSTAQERKLLPVQPSLGSERYEGSREFCRGLRAEHGETTLPILGSPPWWHEATFPMAWCTTCPAATQSWMSSYTMWALQSAWASLTVQRAHLAPITVHLHPASGPWDCNHHLWAFCWFWHK